MSIRRGGIRGWRRFQALLLGCALSTLAVLPARTQTSTTAGLPTLGSNCTATLLNHSVQLNADGTFEIPNVPYNSGKYRAHIVCLNDDGTTSGALSAFVTLVANGDVDFGTITLGNVPATPTSLQVTPSQATLTTVGATSQMYTITLFGDGSSQDVTSDPGTTYTSSNAAIATISATGVLTVTGPGTATVTARYDGLVATTTVSVSALIDSDGDGMPDEWEIAHGLNPYDPSDAGLDPDNDGLTNLQEYQLGTDPHIADTDGDGLSDGQEVKLGTNPLVADTDGDGIPDGQEVLLGTNPLNPDTDGDGIPDGIEVKLGTNPLVADPTTTVIGRVVGPDMKPVAGASVTTLQYFTATADSTGAFSIPYVPTDAPGAGTTLMASVIAVLSGGSVENGASGAVTAVASGVTDLGVIQLGVSSGVVSGVVSNPKGKIVAGAQVTIAGGNVMLNATTDATGTYRVTNLPAGAVTASALDPSTGLRGQSSGTLQPGAGSSLGLNITVSGYGTVAGTVSNADGSPAASGATVAISGSLTATTTVGPLGAYSFPFVPLGAFTVQSTDTNGHAGTNSGYIAVTSQTVTSNIQFLGSGTVTGTVADKSGNKAANASVKLMSTAGGTPQKLTTQTDANGSYTLSNVYVGSFAVSASLASSHLGGTTLGSVTQQGQTVTINVTLDTAGTIQGTVFHSDGATPAVGVNVQAGQNAIVATTDTNGHYELDFVPAGNVALLATDPSDGDQGTATVTVTAGVTASAPAINLNGQGTVNVTVVDASGNVVPSAELTLTSDTGFTQQLTGMSSATGTYTFQQVLAGDFTVMATNPANELAGTAQGTVTVGGTVAVTVPLQAAGSISGVVLGADGQTPAAGITVQLDQSTTTVSANDGSYQFSTVPAGTHALVALDGSGNSISPAVNATITTQGQAVTANLTLIGRGTVTGTVTNVDGTPAVGIAVSIASLAPGFATTFQTQTDTSGNYSIASVPVGPLTVQAYSAAASAQAASSVPSDGATVTVNLMLSTNLVSSRRTLYDADAMPYDIDATGEIESGMNSVFSGLGLPPGDRNDETLSITLDSDGSVHPFYGSNVATTTQNGQEMAIAQTGVAGLNITRRIYVPATGYMARYLEILSNPTASAISVDVNLQSGYRYTHEDRNGYTYNGTPEVVASSSGDASFNVTTDPMTTDHWIIEGTDLDADPFLVSTNVPAVGYVFDDGKGSVSLGSGSFVTDSTHGELEAAWKSVNVPAGGTVTLMHFVSQEVLRSAATAAVQRLIQLPPEALAGLSAADAASIVNFQVPANLNSALPALPALNGQINGGVAAGDGVTPIPGALVSLQSVDPIFARTYQAVSDSTGSFQFTGNQDGLSDAVAIPLENFNISALHPTTQLVSPTFSGQLTTAAPSTTQAIVFSNSGLVSGTVMLTAVPPVVVTSGNVTFTSPSLTTVASAVVPIQSDGTYSITGLPTGIYSLVASVTGSLLTGNTSVTVTNGQAVTNANIVIGATGTLMGTVRGSASGHPPLPGVTVNLYSGAQTISTISDSNGGYSFTDVPPGSYTVAAYDPTSNTAATLTVVITASGTTSQDIILGSGGTVVVQVTAPSGVNVSVANLAVTLSVVTASGTQTFTGTTNAGGTATINNVPLGQLTAQVTGANGYAGSAVGTLGLSGQTATLSVTLGQYGSVSGTLYTYDGKIVSGGQIQLYGYAPGSSLPGLLASTTTNAQGGYSFNAVPVSPNPFTIVALLASDGDQGQATGSVITGGQQVTVNVNLDGVGTINVTVNTTGGSPDGGATVTASSQYNSNYQGTTTQQGTVTLTNVLAGNVLVRASDPVTQLSAQANVTLPPGGQQSVTLTLQPSGTIMGVVYAADGQTPAAGATVDLYQLGGYRPIDVAKSKADGTYSFTSIPLGTYVLNVYDANGIFRTYATNLILNKSGQVLTQNLTFVGVGTVNGTVTNPDGSAAVGVNIQISSQGAIIENFNSGTDNQGNYSIPGVPVGQFQVTAQNLGAGLGGTALGTIKSDGDIETVNIQMVSNVVSLSQTLTDFNGFKYDVQPNGTLLNGTYASNPLLGYGGIPDYNYAFQLSLYLNGTPTAFTGASTGVTSMAGRDISIQQLDLDGLNVTRSIYVPSNGYFARYLETLSNPGTTPITVDVQVSGGVEYAYNESVPVQITSSGDAALSNADLTFVTDDDNGSNPWPYSQPSLGEAFEGAAAPLPITVASYTVPTPTNGLYYPQLLYRWNSVTIPPGGQVEFMHFATQQTISGQASASVTRLDQLPPEGLNGLLPSDLASIQNFAVPANGISTLAPLTVPSLGSVTGFVYGGDGQTPDPGAWVVLRGSDLYFGATAWQLADGTGAFDFTAAPVENYTLEATDPHSYYNSPLTSGTFASGANNSTTNVVFSNQGAILGTLSVPAETQYTSAIAELYSQQTEVDSATVNADGTFTMPAAPAGTYNLLTVATPAEGNSGASGTGLVVSQSVTVTAGQPTNVVVNLPDTGTVTGVFTTAQSTPEAMAEIYLSGTNFFRAVITDSTGAFTLPQIPVGTYTITGTEPSTSLVAAATITVTAAATITQNLQIVSGATINLTVNLANGTPAANSSVTIQRNTTNYSGQVLAGVTNSSGQLQIVNVPIGAYTVVAYYPGLQTYSSSIQITATGTVTANGQVIPLTVTLPQTSTITGVVTTYSGGTVAAPYVTLTYQGLTGSNYVSSSTVTGNGVGSYTISPVLAATTATLQAEGAPAYVLSNPVSITTAASGQTLTQNLKLPVSVTLVATGVDGNGNPLVNCAFSLAPTVASVTSMYSSYIYNTCQPGGTATFNSILDGTYGIDLSDGSGNFLGAATVVIPTSDDGKTVNVTVQTGFTGTISGTLVAADGVTPAPPATYNVQLLDADTQEYSEALATVTSTDGTYSFPNIVTGRDGYVVQVQMTQAPTNTYYQGNPVTASGKITANGQTQTLNVTLPIPVVAGVVYQSDGTTPVANPNVTATVPNGGSPVTFYGVSDAQGNYSVAVAASDTASIIANANGLTTQAQVQVQLTDTVDTQNIVLVNSGTVSGTVTDTSGNPVAYAPILITSTGSTYVLQTETANDGTYSVPYVATGTITVQAGGSYGYDCYVNGTGTLANNGDTLTVNVTFDYSSCTYTGGNTMLEPAPLPNLQRAPALGTNVTADLGVPQWLVDPWPPPALAKPKTFAGMAQDPARIAEAR